MELDPEKANDKTNATKEGKEEKQTETEKQAVLYTADGIAIPAQTEPKISVSA